MNRKSLVARTLPAVFLAIGMIAATASAAPTFAEKKQDDVAHEQLCSDLWLIYDSNMDIYYDKSRSLAERQQAWDAAHDALSDFRKQGCKAPVARVVQVVDAPIISVHEATLSAR